MAIHKKHLWGKHLLCQILFTDKLRGRWEAACSFSALKGKPGAPSLEKWWRGKRTCGEGWLQACKQCGQNHILMPKGEVTGLLLPWDGGKVRSWSRGLSEKLWRTDQTMTPSPRRQKSWNHGPMLLGSAALLPSQSRCPCNPLLPQQQWSAWLSEPVAQEKQMARPGRFRCHPQPTQCCKQLVPLLELSTSLACKGSGIVWAWGISHMHRIKSG